jgi:hypothetical protein
MTPHEKKLHDVDAINSYGVQIRMTIVERDGRLILWNGLDQRWLSLPPDLKADDLEKEIKRVSGVTRLIIF